MQPLPDAPLYADATRAAGLLFTSGQIPVSEDGHTPDSITEQAHLVFDNLECVLASHGCTMNDLLQVTVFLLDINDDFDAYNAVYRERVTPYATPARTTVQVAQFRGPKQIELHAIAQCERVSLSQETSAMATGRHRGEDE